MSKPRKATGEAGERLRPPEGTKTGAFTAEAGKADGASPRGAANFGGAMSDKVAAGTPVGTSVGAIGTVGAATGAATGGAGGQLAIGLELPVRAMVKAIARRMQKASG